MPPRVGQRLQNADDHAQHGGKRAPKELPLREALKAAFAGTLQRACLLLLEPSHDYYAHKLRAVMFAPTPGAAAKRAGLFGKWGGGGGGAASLGDASPLSLAEAAVASARQSGRGGESGGGGVGTDRELTDVIGGRFGRDLSLVCTSYRLAYGRPLSADVWERGRAAGASAELSELAAAVCAHAEASGGADGLRASARAQRLQAARSHGPHGALILVDEGEHPSDVTVDGVAVTEEGGGLSARVQQSHPDRPHQPSTAGADAAAADTASGAGDGSQVVGRALGWSNSAASLPGALQAASYRGGAGGAKAVLGLEASSGGAALGAAASRGDGGAAAAWERAGSVC